MLFCSPPYLLRIKQLAIIIDMKKQSSTAKYIRRHIQQLQETKGLFIDEPIPTSKQIYNIVQKHKLVESPAIVDVGQLVAWCQERSVIPLNEDQAYVLAFNHSELGEEPFFRFVDK